MNCWPPFGYPMYPTQMGGGSQDETIRMAKAIIKEHKAEKKRKAEEAKKKSDSKKPRTFNILEVTALLLLFSLPVALLQKYIIIMITVQLNDLVQHVH